MHAESAEAWRRRRRCRRGPGPIEEPVRSYADYLATRPRGIENLAIAQVIEAARVTGGRAHVVHLSSSDALPMLASARRDGVRITAESCPHYLTLAAEEIRRRRDRGQVLRRRSARPRNRELLWAGLREEVLDLVVSDHSPCTAAMKETASGDFGAAWGGISSLQLGLPLVWTQARRRGFSLADVARWMAERPARLAGLAAKGRIAPRLRRGLLPVRARRNPSPSIRACCTTGTRSRRMPGAR